MKYQYNPLLLEVNLSLLKRAGDNTVVKLVNSGKNSQEAKEIVARRMAGISARRSNRWRSTAPRGSKVRKYGDHYRAAKYPEAAIKNEKVSNYALSHYAPSFNDQMRATVNAI